MDQPASIYAATRTQVVAELQLLTTDDAAQPVPSCPGWSIKDVVAHVVGLVADLLAGVQPPLGTDEMTARQVAERADRSLDEVCDEWLKTADAFAAFLEGQPLYALGLTADLAVHVHDIAETTSTVSPPPAAATSAGCRRYVPLLQERAAERLDIAFTVELNGERFEPTAGTTPLALHCSPTDFLRSVTGRRTRSQVAALEWSADPSPLLDQAFTQYGPYRPESVS